MSGQETNQNRTAYYDDPGKYDYYATDPPDGAENPLDIADTFLEATPLHLACAGGQSETVKALLKEGRANIEKQ